MSEVDNTSSTANDATTDTTAVAAAEPVASTVAEPQEKVDNSIDAVLSRSFEKLSKPTEVDKDKKPAVAADPTKPVVAATAATDGKVVDPVSGRTLEPVKAPVLPPSLRDKWTNVPREFQEYWAKREADMSTKLTETADDRKLAKEFRDVAGPYEAMLRSGGTTAVAYSKELFRTAHTLLTGTPQQKAHVIASLVQQHQPDATTLQAIFSGKVKPQGLAAPNPQAQIESLVDQRLKAAQEATQINDAKSAYEAFKADPKNEFVDDVQDLMKRGIDAGLVGGNTFAEAIKNAYDWACRQHPEVSQVLTARAAQASTTAASPAAAAAATTPVASVKPSLGAGNRTAPPKKKMSVQEAAEYAWKKHGGA